MDRYVWESEKGHERRVREKQLEISKEMLKDSKKRTDQMKKSTSGYVSEDPISPISRKPDLVTMIFRFPLILFIWSWRATVFCYHNTLAINSKKLRPTFASMLLYPFASSFVLSLILYTTIILTNFGSLRLILLPILGTLGVMSAVCYQKMKPINHANLSKFLKLIFSYIPLIIISYILAFLLAYWLVIGVVGLISSLYK